ncbi:MAG: fadD13 [Frankiales bacterium]|nr:fadD13 [Frankiales bacterium]
MTTDTTTGSWTAGETDDVLRVLQDAVAEVPDQVFLDFSGELHTYADVWERSLARAGGLARLGVRAGDTVVAMLDNNVDAVVTWFAANVLGAVWVPVNTALRGDFLRHQVADAGASVVLCEEDYLVRLVAVEDELPEAKAVVVRGAAPDAGHSRLTVVALAQVDEGEPATTPVAPAPGALSLLIYTSGTTGPSKGCMISHNYVCNMARSVGARRGRGAKVWTPLPLFHLNAAATSVLATACARGTLTISKRFSVSGFWPEIERSGAEFVSVLGMMITVLAQMPDTPEMLRCKGQIKHAGGAPWTPELIETWTTRFGVGSAGSSVFGLSEASFLTSNDEGLPAPLGASGRRNDDFDVRIVDENDVELPPGSAGEIVARPKRPHVMFEGYWRRPEETLKVFRNLWFHTGDIGRFDDEGWFWFVDRKKDYLRRRGENISSFELESSFQKHPEVKEVAVHAVPSDVSEDDVKATVVLVDGATVSEEELCRWSVDRLPYYAVPRYVEFRPTLPRTPTGKVLKHQLRGEGVTPSTWDRETSDVQVGKR